MSKKTKVIIALSVFTSVSVIELLTPYPRVQLVVFIMMSIHLCGAISFSFLLNALPISKPLPPIWFPFALALIMFLICITPFFLKIEVVSNMMNDLIMVFLIMFYGVAIYSLYDMYKRIKIRFDNK